MDLYVLELKKVKAESGLSGLTRLLGWKGRAPDRPQQCGKPNTSEPIVRKGV